MFRGKESSNRIELSRLVQDLLNFAVLGSLRLWGWGVWVDGGVGWLGGTPYTHAHTHACTHTHTCTCMCGKHDNSMQMAAPLDLGKSRGFPMMSYVRAHACTCMRACACACGWGAPPHHPPPPSTHPPTPSGGDPRNQSKFNST